MLILSRKPGESIVIDGRITIRVMRVEGDAVKIGIEAPRDVPVHRQEVYDEIQRNNKEALTDKHPQIPHFLPHAVMAATEKAPAGQRAQQ